MHTVRVTDLTVGWQRDGNFSPCHGYTAKSVDIVIVDGGVDLMLVPLSPPARTTTRSMTAL